MKIKFLIVLSLFMVCVNAQITNKGVPLSWKIHQKKISKREIPTIKMPRFDLKSIKAEDLINDKNRSKPWRFGYEFNVDIGFKNAGVWDELPNGGRIWRVNIYSKGAKTLNFVFDTYKVPVGATLYLYNDDKSDLLGAYTNVFNNPDQKLGTWMVEGENIWLEYYEPISVKGQGLLNISKVIHGYRSVTKNEIAGSLNNSGDCNLDVDCSVGSDFDFLKDKLKHAVALVVINGENCSGTLINNTRNDGAPYFLTANHCKGDLSTWAFRFNWISPEASCATPENSTDTEIVQTTCRASLLAANSESDFRLIKIEGGLDPSWKLEWAGWDRTDRYPNYVVGIHHPSGDIMKVCRDDSGVIKKKNKTNTDPLADTWEITSEGNGWELGVTEGGSSGSALFNQDGRIIGQLFGGSADCEGIINNKELDYYGRFAVSWDKGTTDDTRLSNWLDPIDSGENTLDMLSDTGIVFPEKPLKIYPIPSKGMLYLANNTSCLLKYSVYNILGQKVREGDITCMDNEIDLSSNVNGVYFIKLKNPSSKNLNFTEKVIIYR